MSIRPFLRQARGGLAAAVGLAVIGTAVDAAAQAPRTSAPMGVSATVVRSCTVEEVQVPALPGTRTSPGQPTASPGTVHRIRCGNQTVTYPVQPGLPPATPLSKGAPATIGRSADGRGVVIQF
jgi:hypothetical protein